MLKLQIFCKSCNVPIYREKGRINENIKLGHNFYCSRKCEYKYKTKRKTLLCENNSCRKEFTKAVSTVLPHNYCSRSCAVRVNNQKFPKRGQGFKVCANGGCAKQFKGETKYCSVVCYSTARPHYTPRELLERIQSAARKLHRTPAKRELRLIVKACIREYGSWNKAILAAGFTPNRSHSQRMYKRANAMAEDGHLCDSIPEAIIDNWLVARGIAHEKDIFYPTTKHKTDWSINGIFIEYFGLAKDSSRYDRTLKKKRNLCREHNIHLIELYPEDIYPTIFLENKLSSFL